MHIQNVRGPLFAQPCQNWHSSRPSQALRPVRKRPCARAVASRGSLNSPVTAKRRWCAGFGPGSGHTGCSSQQASGPEHHRAHCTTNTRPECAESLAQHARDSRTGTMASSNVSHSFEWVGPPWVHLPAVSVHGACKGLPQPTHHTQHRWHTHPSRAPAWQRPALACNSRGMRPSRVHPGGLPPPSTAPPLFHSPCVRPPARPEASPPPACGAREACIASQPTVRHV